MDLAPDQAARDALNAFWEAQRKNPDLIPYMGPEDTLKRFLAGDVITADDMLTDESLWTVQAVLPEQMRRLGWMLDNLKGE